MGTGTALAFTPDHFLTACHVVAGAKRVVLSRDGDRQDSMLTAAIPTADVCLLIRPSRLPAQAISRSNAVSPNAGITLVGSGETNSAYRLSRGRVVAQGMVAGVPLILTDAPVPPGMSGGGAIDGDGRLVGIAVGRWRTPDLGVIVALSALEGLRAVSPDSLRRFPALPAYLDDRLAWPEMLRLGLRLQTNEAVPPRSQTTEGWSFSRDGRVCQATTFDAGQSSLGMTLSLTLDSEGVAVSLSVDREDTPLPIASRPLTATLYPSRQTFRLRPARLVQSVRQARDNRWNARWELDDADVFLGALPAASALVVSSRRRDLGALPIDPLMLWRGYRDTCLGSVGH